MSQIGTDEENTTNPNQKSVAICVHLWIKIGNAPTPQSSPNIRKSGRSRDHTLYGDDVLPGQDVISGWWGVARHFHYVPELILAAAWTIPAGFTHFLPWFYWIFLFILLMDRAIRDEKRCARKYGDDWKLYTQRVRWRVLPGIF